MKRTVVVVATLLLALSSSLAWAARPLETEDAEPLDPKNFELEASADYAREAGTDLWTAKGVFAAGILPGLEARFELPLVLVDPDSGPSQAGVGDAVFGAKYRFVEEGEVMPALAAGLAVRLPTGDTGRGLGEREVDVTVLGIVGKAFGPLVLHGNLGYTFVTANRDSEFWTLAASAEYQLTKELSLVGEALGFLSTHHSEPDTGRARIGMTYLIRDNVKLDAAVGHGFTPGSPRVLVTLGVTIGF